MTRYVRYHPAIDSALLLGVGSAHGGAPDEDVPPLRRILLPDPEARHGWREYYVGLPKPGGRRAAGFRR